jgi:ATP-binding cassette subfamily B protein
LRIQLPQLSSFATGLAPTASNYQSESYPEKGAVQSHVTANVDSHDTFIKVEVPPALAPSSSSPSDPAADSSVPKSSAATAERPMSTVNPKPSAKPASGRLKITAVLRPHWKALAIAMAAVLGETLADVGSPWPIKIVIDSLSKESTKLPLWLTEFVTRLFGNNTLAILNFAVAAVAVIAIVDAISSYLEKYMTTSVSQLVSHDLRLTVYDHIQRLSLADHDEKQTGDLITRVTGDIEAVQDFITSALFGILIDVLTLVGMITVMFMTNWRFTLIALSVVPVLMAVVYSFTRKIKKASRAVRKKQGELISVVQEVLTSVRVVQAFAREDYEQDRFEAESMENVEAALEARSIKAKLAPLVEVVAAVGTCLVLGFGGRMAMRGEIHPGTLYLFIVYLAGMYKPMRDLSKMTDTVSKATIGYERIQEILEIESKVHDLPGARRAPKFKGKIEFDNVSFGYDDEHQVLKNISLKIEPGQVAAIVGPSGTGKSTLVNLIARFYDPVSGTVKIDGGDVRKFTLKSLREQISFVLQEALLFNAPIWKNIAYGKPDAPRREIMRAAELANAHEFIEKMPEGYETMVGERGVSLSGGQRQRIAIARAILHNTPILILDEPTTGLDAASEQAIMEALNRLMKGKTSIIIAHHLSSISHSDVIFVVKDSELVETGTHEELLAAGKEYAELYKLQVTDVVLANSETAPENVPAVAAKTEADPQVAPVPRSGQSGTPYE